MDREDRRRGGAAQLSFRPPFKFVSGEVAPLAIKMKKAHETELPDRNVLVPRCRVAGFVLNDDGTRTWIFEGE